jgi:multidrug resistance protein MdtO
MLDRSAKCTLGAERRRDGFLDLLWETLKPFPGRAQLTLRLAMVCTAIVLVADTFRLPFQDLMPFFVLFITKEEKVTTTVSALLVLATMTLAIGTSILLFECTGNRPEFRVPAIAVEIFVGMYLFRVLAIAPVGWILGFLCAASQSLVYLFPSPEETVHQFLWLWVALAFSIGLAWLANLLLFPVSATRLLQREFVAAWHAVAAASARLITSSLSESEVLLRPLAKRGPTRLLKLLKLSLIESHDLRGKQVQLTRLILSVDKIAKLLLSYTCARLKSSAPVAISSADIVLLGRLNKQFEYFQRKLDAGLVPSDVSTRFTKKPADDFPALQLVEAENTVGDLANGHAESKDRAERPAVRTKPSFFVLDAFSNPRHVQFALKVTLAGMIGYLFYTASDYYGIHTVFYTPLIIALASTGATIHKGVLRIVGCVVGGALALICSVWVIPRYETLETFLFIVFCVHGLAAWIASGSDRISYLGLQVALAFDLGFLQGYGPPNNIDPLRDRFIGIVLGICIIATVFSLLWPESADSIARERIAACLRAITRLLQLGVSNDHSQSSISQREQCEWEIGSRLSEANSYEEQATFEAMLYGSDVVQASRLAEAAAGVEEIYVASLLWLREQVSSKPTSADGEGPNTSTVLSKPLGDTIKEFAELTEWLRSQTASQAPTPADRLLAKKDTEEIGGVEHFGSSGLQELNSALMRFETLGQRFENGRARRQWLRKENDRFA